MYTECARQCSGSWDNKHNRQKPYLHVAYHLLVSNLCSVLDGDDCYGEHKKGERGQGVRWHVILNRSFWLGDLWVKTERGRGMSHADKNVLAKTQRETCVLCFAAQQGGQCGRKRLTMGNIRRRWDLGGKRIADEVGFWSLAFTLTELGSCWRGLGRRVTWSDLHFDWIPLQQRAEEMGDVQGQKQRR